MLWLRMSLFLSKLPATMLSALKGVFCIVYLGRALLAARDQQGAAAAAAAAEALDWCASRAA
jgi:hypothetical protein